jgi:hypothetical protein
MNEILNKILFLPSVVVSLNVVFSSQEIVFKQRISAKIESFRNSSLDIIF